MSVQQAKVRAQAMGCLVGAMALWGSSFIALKIAFAELSPMWVIFGRMLLGSLVFIAAWRWRGRIEYRRGDWKYLLSLAWGSSLLFLSPGVMPISSPPTGVKVLL